ncbi:MAG TPA: shikimate dehydrogenase [Fimbriimonadaceae bacterium]|nr:shikimate dehydrogenase [Fimbriimonadaceae bacterium]
MDVSKIEGVSGPFEWRDAPSADFAVVGDPVAHSLSPKMHAAAYRALGLDLSYVALRVPIGEFDEAMAHLASVGYQGVNVTVPLKEAAFRWATKTRSTEQRIGAVNTLRFSDGAAINTDALGLMDVLAKEGIDESVRALVLGAGGTARAVLVALDEAGFEVKCWNRTRENLETVLRETRVEADVSETPDPAGCGLVINATSATMSGKTIDVPWMSAPPEGTVIEAYYGTGSTPFLQSAKEAGLKVLDGRRLLVAQGARSFAWWTGKEAPVRDMLSAVQ